MEAVSETSDYIQLMKPRVMSLVLFSGIVGMVLAPGHVHPVIALVSIICIAAGAGAAGAINMWYDRDMDAVMTRTQHRPIVIGKISPENGLAFGIIMAFFSVFVMATCVNYLSSAVLLFIILFYVFIYTMLLKRTTPQNIVIGGFSGALPPLVGWTTVTNSISIEPLILVLLIFLWTPPHFWALALYRSSDYEKANVPMMPLTHGDYYTKIQILVYTLLVFGCSLLPFIVGITGKLYLAAAIILGTWFVYYAAVLLRDKKNTIAPRMFFFSIFYLFMILIMMVLDK